MFNSKANQLLNPGPTKGVLTWCQTRTGDVPSMSLVEPELDFLIHPMNKNHMSQPESNWTPEDTMHEADNSVSSTEEDDTSTNTVYDTEQSGYSNAADHNRRRTRVKWHEHWNVHRAHSW